jgi:hypothetical protein
VFYTLGEHGSLSNEAYSWNTLPADDKVIHESQTVDEYCDLIMELLSQSTNIFLQISLFDGTVFIRTQGTAR